MAQHYVDPKEIIVTSSEWPYMTKKMMAVLEKQGQIEPLLVKNDDGVFKVVGYHGPHFVYAGRKLEWPTMLVEDDWEPDEVD